MLSGRGLYLHILQTLISWESVVSVPGTSSFFRRSCLRMMGVKVGEYIYIGEGTTFFNSNKLVFGNRVAIGENSRIVCHDLVTIGDDFVGAMGLYINSGSHDLNSLQPNNAPIIIGDRVWCGMRVTICAGVTIGSDVVIGAGSVVTRSIPDGVLAAGVPAKTIRKLERTEIMTMEDYYTPSG